MSQSTTFSPKNDPLVRDVVNRIVAESSPLRVILFGLRAQGTAHPMSDIDVLVVLPDGIDRRKAAVQPGLRFRTILQTGMDVYMA